MEQFVDYLIVERTPNGYSQMRKHTDYTQAINSYELLKSEYNGEHSIVLLKRFWGLVSTTQLAAS